MPLTTPEHTNELIATMRELIEALPDHQRALKRAWKATIAALVVGIGALVLGLGAIGLAMENRNDVSELDAVKTDNVVAVCNILNERIIANIRAGLVDSLRTLADEPANLTEREQEIIDLYTKQVAEEFPFLDCSEKGIAQLVKEYANIR